ncbi:MAG: IclR family transcriptional regulator [Leptolinea sp.]|jgi:DNA-binding IclR family transcriptional regulator|nr:IclR family transcriptional regulator [Leptolinea sp.]
MDNEVSPILNRAVAILDCFNQDRPEIGVREAARLVGLSSSATGRLMASLRNLGILSQNSESKAYSLGPRVLTWAGVYTATLDLRKRALPFLEELYVSTNETISLYILQGSDRICVERLESAQTVRIVARIGRRLPLYAGSAGKVLLAFLPSDRLREILPSLKMEPLTPNTITDRSRLEHELVTIRKNGFAVSHGEWISDASGIAAAIFDQFNEPVGAISISGPTQRFTSRVIELFTPPLIHAAVEISRDMGYRGPFPPKFPE